MIETAVNEVEPREGCLKHMPTAQEFVDAALRLGEWFMADQRILKLVIASWAGTTAMRYVFRWGADVGMRNRINEARSPTDLNPNEAQQAVVNLRADVGGIYAMLLAINGFLAAILGWLIADRFF